MRIPSSLLRREVSRRSFFNPHTSLVFFFSFFWVGAYVLITNGCQCHWVDGTVSAKGGTQPTDGKFRLVYQLWSSASDLPRISVQHTERTKRVCRTVWLVRSTSCCIFVAWKKKKLHKQNKLKKKPRHRLNQDTRPRGTKLNGQYLKLRHYCPGFYTRKKPADKTQARTR